MTLAASGRWSPRRLAVPVRGAAAVLRTTPVTLGYLGVLWAVGAVTGSLASGPPEQLARLVGVGVPSLLAGRWWTPVTSGLWCAGAVSYVATTVLMLVMAVPAERRLGSRRMAALLLATQVLGTVLGTAVVALAALTADDWAVRLATGTAVGATPAVVGAGLAATASFGRLWRWRVRIATLVVLGMLVLYSGSLEDVLRLAAGLVGLATGRLVAGRPTRSGRTASTTETRTLVAITVAVLAAGPLLAAVSGTAAGPLSVLRFLLLPPPPDPASVQAVCADPTVSEDCLALQFRLRVGGIGPAVMALLPVVLLLVLADGLRRARRFAWWAALAVNAGLALLGVVLALLTARVPAERLVAFGGMTDAQFYTSVAFAVLQPLAVVVVLLATRDCFAVPAPRGTVRAWTVTVGTALGVAAGAYVLLGHALRDGFVPVPGWAQLMFDLPTRFVPPGYLGEVDVRFLPVTAPATVVYEWTGIVFWTATLAATLRVLRRNAVQSGDGTSARELLVRHGGSSLSWQATWAGNAYWFTDDGRAALAYRVIGRIALTSGEPFGAVDARCGAIDGFARYCADGALIPCLYGVGDGVRRYTAAQGWDAVQVAEETVVPLGRLAFTGKKWQDVRTALNKAAKAGISAEWITFGRAPLAVTDQIRAISEEWVAEKGLPEMGFTLGGLDELDDDRVRCLIAVDPDRTVYGITSWLPVHRDGTPIGWTLDFMRRRDAGFRGVMEFLIASAALRFQEEGAEWMSLSGAPLARLDRGEQVDVLQRLLDVSGRALEPVYGFGSLLAFKAKFQPEYHPLFMVYPDPAALPAIATAVARAYLPSFDAVGTVRLLRGLRR